MSRRRGADAQPAADYSQPVTLSTEDGSDGSGPAPAFSLQPDPTACLPGETADTVPPQPAVEMHDTEIGLLISRSKNGAFLQFTRITRDAHGRISTESKGLQPRHRALLELSQEYGRLRDFLWPRGVL